MSRHVSATHTQSNTAEGRAGTGEMEAAGEATRNRGGGDEGGVGRLTPTELSLL